MLAPKTSRNGKDVEKVIRMRFRLILCKPAEMKVMRSHLVGKTPEEAMMMLANKELNQNAFWNPTPTVLVLPSSRPTTANEVAISLGMIGYRYSLNNRPPREQCLNEACPRKVKECCCILIDVLG
jgi:hypothetical protein